MTSTIETTPELKAAVSLVNTYDELADPKDRLSTIDTVHRMLRRHRLESLAAGLGPRDLAAARLLRDELRTVFVATDDTDRAAMLNDLLSRAGARLELRDRPNGWELTAHSPRPGIGELTAVLAAALARVLAAGGGPRLGVCAAHPCRCVFVDATRARRRRYCCELCNDRVASAAYRKRVSRTTSENMHTE